MQLTSPIPPRTWEIAENSEPEGVHGLGTGNNLEYYGPWPRLN